MRNGKLWHDRRMLPVAATGVGVVVMAVASAKAAHSGNSLGVYTRDIRTVAAEHHGKTSYDVGSVSQFGIMMWAAAAALAFLIAYLNPDRRRWLILFGAFMSFLGADDSLTLHESHVHGIPQDAYYVVYAAFGLSLLYGLVKRRSVDALAVTFVVGGALLALSILMDLLTNAHYLVEDGSKLLGILIWSTVPLLALPRRRPHPTPAAVDNASTSASASASSTANASSASAVPIR